MNVIFEANRFLSPQNDNDPKLSADGKTGGDSLTAMSLFEELNEDGEPQQKDKNISAQIIAELNSGKDYIASPQEFITSLSKSKHKEMLKPIIAFPIWLK